MENPAKVQTHNYPGNFNSDFCTPACNDDTQNYPFSRLQLIFETFGHSTL